MDSMLYKIVAFVDYVFNFGYLPDEVVIPYFILVSLFGLSLIWRSASSVNEN